MIQKINNRQGRNVCIGSRITDACNELIDKIAENENRTKSEIVAEAIEDYLKKKLNPDL